MIMMPYKTLHLGLKKLIEDPNTTQEQFNEEAKRARYSKRTADAARYYFKNREEKGYVKPNAA